MNFPIHFHYLLCGGGILEAGDVFAAAGDAGVAEFGSAEHLSDGGGELVGAVGIDIKVVGAARFLQTRAFGSHYGQSALHGFDDGNLRSARDRQTLPPSDRRRAGRRCRGCL